MINISWFVTPESTILLGSLWEKAVPAVIDELAHCGYTVDHDDIAKANMEHGFRQQSRLEPGPATLTAARKTAQDGSVQFVLDGEKFGMAGSPGKDPVVWMRLLTLGLRLAGSYSVVPLTADPDSGPASRQARNHSSDRTREASPAANCSLIDGPPTRGCAGPVSTAGELKQVRRIQREIHR